MTDSDTADATAERISVLTADISDAELMKVLGLEAPDPQRLRDIRHGIAFAPANGALMQLAMRVGCLALSGDGETLSSAEVFACFDAALQESRLVSKAVDAALTEVLRG